MPVADAGASVEHGTVRGSREAPLVWACPDDHERRSADPDAVAAEVLDAMDVATRPRLFGRERLRCGACGEDLVLPGRRTMRSVTVVDAGVPASRLTFDVAVLRCTADAIENLPPEVADDVATVARRLVEHGPGPGP